MIERGAAISFIPPVLIAHSHRFLAEKIDDLIAASEAQVDQNSSS
jgi:hypothetical protein